MPTYRDLMMLYHWDAVDDDVPGGINACPDVIFEGADIDKFCAAESEEMCTKCWDRECPPEIALVYIEREERRYYENTDQDD